jgi:hypothetical protein
MPPLEPQPKAPKADRPFVDPAFLKRFINRHGTMFDRHGKLTAILLLVLSLVGFVPLAYVVRPLTAFATLLACFVGIIAVRLWHQRRVYAMQRRILEERPCLGCGYSLNEAPLDDVASGKCPECGFQFNLRTYTGAT